MSKWAVRRRNPAIKEAQWVLLVTAAGISEAAVYESMLQPYNIPVLRRYLSTDTSGCMPIHMGDDNNGVEVLVPDVDLEEARRVVGLGENAGVFVADE